MCAKLSKLFIVLFVCLGLSSPLYAWAIQPGVRTPKPTVATPVEATETPATVEEAPVVTPTPVVASAVAPLVPAKEPEKDYEILNALTAKSRLTAEQAVAIAELKVAVEDLEAVNEDAIERVEELETEVVALSKKANGIHLGLGLGVTYDPSKNMDIEYEFGAQLLTSMRVGKNQFIIGVEYPNVYDAYKDEFDAEHIRGSFSYIREF